MIMTMASHHHFTNSNKQVLRLRGVRSIVKPPGQEEDDSCPDRLLLLSQEVPEDDEGHGGRPTLGGW